MKTNAAPCAMMIADPPPRHPSSDRPGYLAAGVGAPVVMLHSSLGSKLQWAALAERLASHFRAIALDLYGYGDSPVPSFAASFTLDDEVQLVTERLDRLVASPVRVHFVGHSYGGLVALRFAQRYSDRIASLSLYEPVAFRLLGDHDAALPGVIQLNERVIRLVTAGRRREAAQAFVDYWSGQGTYACLPLSAQANIARRIDKVPLDFQAAWRWPLSSTDLSAIVAPTLLLAGTRSPAVTQGIVGSLARALPNCRTWWFDAGHMAPIEQANRINYWIEAFVGAYAEGGVAAPARAVVTPAIWASAAD